MQNSSSSSSGNIFSSHPATSSGGNISITAKPVGASPPTNHSGSDDLARLSHSEPRSASALALVHPSKSSIVGQPDGKAVEMKSVALSSVRVPSIACLSSDKSLKVPVVCDLPKPHAVSDLDAAELKIPLPEKNGDNGERKIPFVEDVSDSKDERKATSDLKDDPLTPMAVDGDGKWSPTVLSFRSIGVYVHRSSLSRVPPYRGRPGFPIPLEGNHFSLEDPNAAVSAIQHMQKYLPPWKATMISVIFKKNSFKREMIHLLQILSGIKDTLGDVQHLSICLKNTVSYFDTTIDAKAIVSLAELCEEKYLFLTNILHHLRKSDILSELTFCVSMLKYFPADSKSPLVAVILPLRTEESWVSLEKTALLTAGQPKDDRLRLDVYLDRHTNLNSSATLRHMRWASRITCTDPSKSLDLTQSDRLVSLHVTFATCLTKAVILPRNRAELETLCVKCPSYDCDVIIESFDSVFPRLEHLIVPVGRKIPPLDGKHFPALKLFRPSVSRCHLDLSSFIRPGLDISFLNCGEFEAKFPSDIAPFGKMAIPSAMHASREKWPIELISKTDHLCYYQSSKEKDSPLSNFLHGPHGDAIGSSRLQKLELIGPPDRGRPMTVFGKCAALKELTLKGVTTTLDGDCFPNLTSLRVLNGTVDLRGHFTALTSITMLDSLKGPGETFSAPLLQEVALTFIHDLRTILSRPKIFPNIQMITVEDQVRATRIQDAFAMYASQHSGRSLVVRVGEDIHLEYVLDLCRLSPNWVICRVPTILMGADPSES